MQAHSGAELGEQAWRIATELGLAKTYDAEYIALARILGCRLVTLDMRLRRGADRLGLVVTPAELHPSATPSFDRADQDEPPATPDQPL